MSFEEGFSAMNISSKIGFILSWLRDPKGKTLFDSLKIFIFKLQHILQIFGFMIKGHNLLNSITLAKNNFNSDKISVIAKNKHGLLFTINCGADLDIINSNREQFVYEKFQPETNDIVLDIGANIGVYSLKSSQSVSPNGKVIAIEADPDIFDSLKVNVQLNSKTNIIPLNYAIFDKQKNVLLYRSTNSSPTNSLEIINNAEKINVKANTIDNVIDELNLKKIDWIKIDVEGVEIQVLNGAKKLLTQNSKLKLIIEVHKKELELVIENMLKNYNFTIEWEHGTMNSPHIYAQR